MGGGYHLLFQRNAAGKVRAVIKAPDGSIYARGDVVDEANAFQSRLTAISNAKTRTYNRTLGLGPNATREEQLQALEQQIMSQFPGWPPKP